jgi:hypothetical protein
MTIWSSFMDRSSHKDYHKICLGFSFNFLRILEHAANFQYSKEYENLKKSTQPIGPSFSRRPVANGPCAWLGLADGLLRPQCAGLGTRISPDRGGGSAGRELPAAPGVRRRRSATILKLGSQWRESAVAVLSVAA